MVLKAWTGKKDKAATMKITAKVMALNVTESVYNVPDVAGIYFLPARSPAMATWPMIGMKRLRMRTMPHE